MPGRVHIQYARERYIMARMEIDLIRHTVASYLPGQRVVDVIELRYVGAYLTIAAVEGRPMTVGMLMHALGMSRNTVKRRLATLIALGYVARKRGNTYTVTEKINLPNLRKVLDRNVRIIQEAVRKLSMLDGTD